MVLVSAVLKVLAGSKEVEHNITTEADNLQTALVAVLKDQYRLSLQTTPLLNEQGFKTDVGKILAAAEANPGGCVTIRCLVGVTQRQTYGDRRGIADATPTFEAQENDADQLAPLDCVLEIMDNAVAAVFKSHREEKQVLVQISPDDEDPSQLILVFSDTGTGMSKEGAIGVVQWGKSGEKPVSQQEHKDPDAPLRHFKRFINPNFNRYGLGGGVLVGLGDKVQLTTKEAGTVDELTLTVDYNHWRGIKDGTIRVVDGNKYPVEIVWSVVPLSQMQHSYTQITVRRLRPQPLAHLRNTTVVDDWLKQVAETYYHFVEGVPQWLWAALPQQLREKGDQGRPKGGLTIKFLDHTISTAEPKILHGTDYGRALQTFQQLMEADARLRPLVYYHRYVPQHIATPALGAVGEERDTVVDIVSLWLYYPGQNGVLTKPRTEGEVCTVPMWSGRLMTSCALRTSFVQLLDAVRHKMKSKVLAQRLAGSHNLLHIMFAAPEAWPHNHKKDFNWEKNTFQAFRHSGAGRDNNRLQKGAELRSWDFAGTQQRWVDADPHDVGVLLRKLKEEWHPLDQSGVIKNTHNAEGEEGTQVLRGTEYQHPHYPDPLKQGEPVLILAREDQALPRPSPKCCGFIVLFEQDVDGEHSVWVQPWSPAGFSAAAGLEGAQRVGIALVQRLTAKPPRTPGTGLSQQSPATPGPIPTRSQTQPTPGSTGGRKRTPATPAGPSAGCVLGTSAANQAEYRKVEQKWHKARVSQLVFLKSDSGLAPSVGKEWRQNKELLNTYEVGHKFDLLVVALVNNAGEYADKKIHEDFPYKRGVRTTITWSPDGTSANMQELAVINTPEPDQNFRYLIKGFREHLQQEGEYVLTIKALDTTYINPADPRNTLRYNFKVKSGVPQRISVCWRPPSGRAAVTALEKRLGQELPPIEISLLDSQNRVLTLPMDQQQLHQALQIEAQDVEEVHRQSNKLSFETVGASRRDKNPGQARVDGKVGVWSKLAITARQLHGTTELGAVGLVPAIHVTVKVSLELPGAGCLSAQPLSLKLTSGPASQLLFQKVSQTQLTASKGAVLPKIEFRLCDNKGNPYYDTKKAKPVAELMVEPPGALELPKQQERFADHDELNLEGIKVKGLLGSTARLAVKVQGAEFTGVDEAVVDVTVARSRVQLNTQDLQLQGADAQPQIYLLEKQAMRGQHPNPNNLGPVMGSFQERRQWVGGQLHSAFIAPSGEVLGQGRDTVTAKAAVARLVGDMANEERRLAIVVPPECTALGGLSARALLQGSGVAADPNFTATLKISVNGNVLREKVQLKDGEAADLPDLKLPAGAFPNGALHVKLLDGLTSEVYAGFWVRRQQAVHSLRLLPNGPLFDGARVRLGTGEEAMLKPGSEQPPGVWQVDGGAVSGGAAAAQVSALNGTVKEVLEVQLPFNGSGQAGIVGVDHEGFVYSPDSLISHLAGCHIEVTPAALQVTQPEPQPQAAGLPQRCSITLTAALTTGPCMLRLAAGALRLQLAVNVCAGQLASNGLSLLTESRQDEEGVYHVDGVEDSALALQLQLRDQHGNAITSVATVKLSPEDPEDMFKEVTSRSSDGTVTFKLPVKRGIAWRGVHRLKVSAVSGDAAADPIVVAVTVLAGNYPAAIRELPESWAPADVALSGEDVQIRLPGNGAQLLLCLVSADKRPLDISRLRPMTLALQRWTGEEWAMYRGAAGAAMQLAAAEPCSEGAVFKLGGGGSDGLAVPTEAGEYRLTATYQDLPEYQSESFRVLPGPPHSLAASQPAPQQVAVVLLDELPTKVLEVPHLNVLDRWHNPTCLPQPVDFEVLLESKLAGAQHAVADEEVVVLGTCRSTDQAEGGGSRVDIQRLRYVEDLQLSEGTQGEFVIKVREVAATPEQRLLVQPELVLAHFYLSSGGQAQWLERVSALEAQQGQQQRILAEAKAGLEAVQQELARAEAALLSTRGLRAGLPNPDVAAQRNAQLMAVFEDAPARFVDSAALLRFPVVDGQAPPALQTFMMQVQGRALSPGVLGPLCMLGAVERADVSRVLSWWFKSRMAVFACSGQEGCRWLAQHDMRYLDLLNSQITHQYRADAIKDGSDPQQRLRMDRELSGLRAVLGADLQQLGFIGFAVNLIHLTPRQLAASSIILPGGRSCNLRESLLWMIFKGAAVFDTTQHMNVAVHAFKTSNARLPPTVTFVTLDGGEYMMSGLPIEGSKNNVGRPQLCFPPLPREDALREPLDARLRANKVIMDANSASIQQVQQMEAQEEMQAHELQRIKDKLLIVESECAQVQASSDQVLAEIAPQLLEARVQLDRLKALQPPAPAGGPPAAAARRAVRRFGPASAQPRSLGMHDSLPGSPPSVSAKGREVADLAAAQQQQQPGMSGSGAGLGPNLPDAAADDATDRQSLQGAAAFSAQGTASYSRPKRHLPNEAPGQSSTSQGDASKRARR